MNKKIVVFDMDGVLINSGDILYRLLQEIFPRLTLQEYKDFFMGNFHDGKEKYAQTNPAIEMEDAEKEERRIYFADQKAQSPLFPGIRELLQSLRDQDFLLAVNTSAYERNALPLLVKNDIFDYFDFVAVFEDSRSKAEKFTMIQKRFECEVDEMVFVTDTVGDMREAAEFGVRTIGVSWGVHTKHQFHHHKEDVLAGVVDTVPELEENIQKILG
jgi:phosphoglycolate phosphatase